MNEENAYDHYSEEYDEWFTNHSDVYELELSAILGAIPANGNGIEIGVGTGRFASKLGIPVGVEPSPGMGKIAQSRGISVIQAKAEQLPIESERYDFALMVTTICFVDDPAQTLSEANRILKKNGHLVLSFIDRDTDLGRLYQGKKKTNKFYQHATFYSTEEILHSLRAAGFTIGDITQCLFPEGDTLDTKRIETGYGTGGFVVVRAGKYKEAIGT